MNLNLTQDWHRVEFPIESDPIPPGGVAVIVRLRVPMPPHIVDAGTTLIREPFGFMSAVSDDPEKTPVGAVSIGEDWVPATLAGDTARALNMGEALVVWVGNKSTEERVFRGKIVGVMQAPPKALA